MKFRHSAPAVLMTAMVVVIATISLVSNIISHNMTATFEETQFTLMGRIMQSKLHGAETKASSGAEMIGAMPSVKQAFAAGNREELLAATRDAFRIIHEKYGISQAQFHVAPATSFLRVHNPEKFGEDLSRYRQMVVEVNRAHAIRKGIEITTSGIAIFGAIPMNDDAGVHTGSFELGLEFGPLLDELKKSYGFELAVFINEKLLRETATSLSGDILNEQNRVGQYVKFYATHAELMRNLVTDGDINITEENHYQREATGVPYGVLLVPVYNYAKQHIGVVAMAKDFSATRSAEGQAIVWQSWLALISFLLLLGVVLTVIRGLLLRPLRLLNQRFAALANNEDGPAPAPIGGVCEELQQLSDHCDQMRSRRGAAKADGGDPS